MLGKLVVDSYSLIALERIEVLKFVSKIDYGIVISEAVHGEVGNICDSFDNVLVERLKGRTLKLSRGLQKLGIGEGEAECMGLAVKNGLNFIVCDDRKLMRQIFFSGNKTLRKIKLLGFSFFLHEFFKHELIKDVWEYFDLAIEKNNWKRSEVQVANYTFLKEKGY